jgi:hypothetical protein
MNWMNRGWKRVSGSLNQILLSLVVTHTAIKSFIIYIGYGMRAIITSRLNNTPPKGEPKAAATPAAADADKISRFLTNVIKASSCQG